MMILLPPPPPLLLLLPLPPSLPLILILIIIVYRVETFLGNGYACSSGGAAGSGVIYSVSAKIL
jgi:hypothetical protein